VRVPVDWLREFVAVPANVDATGVAARLASCGFATESVEGDVIDVEVTANRPDCLSIQGLGREAAVAFDVALKPVPRARPVPTTPSPVGVALDDPGCARYALGMADVTIGPSPSWLAARLAAAGVRPINNVVDVTNYVMLEMGHPMHAFDVAKLAGPEIRVRRARPGERITTLDGESRTLDDTMLVIADLDVPVAIAGVMGGAGSEVSATTARIALESAWFQPASVRATSRKLGLKTEASARFERGADISAPVTALRRALALLEEIGAGKASAGLVDVHPQAVVPRRVPLQRTHLSALVGVDIPDAEVERILKGLGFELASTGQGWHAVVPTFRVDIAREADLIEEVARHWGFDRVPATLPPLKVPPPARAAATATEGRLRGLARGAGLQEAVTFTFIEREAGEPFLAPGSRLVEIANPLSEKFAVLRPSLLPGLVDSLVYNRRREAGSVRLFELGAVFGANGESNRLGWVLTGNRFTHWSGNGGAVDFFDAAGIAELLAQAFGFRPDEVIAVPSESLPWFVRGRGAELRLAGTAIGHAGELRSEIVAARGLDAGVVVGGEIDLTAVGAPRATPGEGETAVQPVPRFPSIVRDLSIVVSERLPAADVRGTIRSNAPSTLADVSEFDRYQGKGVPDGHVSLSIRLTFRAADRTLTDSEAQQAVDAIVASLARAHGATLRGS
jgi:phenylalanyl-tRNA synthetase beta chain